MRTSFLLAAPVLAAAYLFGAYSARHELLPVRFFHALKTRAGGTAPEDLYTFDQAGRLASGDKKKAITCPQQTDRTAVLLLIGQSNAGNHGGQRFRSEHGEKVVNFFDDRCYVAASPLLGSDGISGEYWTQLGNLLLDRGSLDQVVLAPAAISGADISRWGAGGDLNRAMTETATQLQQLGYIVTHVLWVQGEIDYVKGTNEKDYRDRFVSLASSLRSHGVAAPIYVAIATKCLGASNGGTRNHSADNPVARAQLALPDPAANLRGGVNSDSLLDDLDRYDDCHFSASGERKVARAWADLLSPAR
ncbi:sialate O-acetylesterase [Bradyrhizobium ottawaense]|uniref:sialate O-acetylesterase n=1 Tax=Bradyrhizobium ottawaense TaxID=931866 RepID=UPI0038505B45